MIFGAARIWIISSPEKSRNRIPNRSYNRCNEAVSHGRQAPGKRR
jgi:hypothetical protein